MNNGIEPNDAMQPDIVSLAYQELRRIAGRMMSDERPDHTLQPTALVNEAYLRLSKPDGSDRTWNSRAHFFSAAAEAMRRILIENARRKQALKRGAGAEHTEWDDSKIESPTPSEDLLAINEALDLLEAEDQALATIVKLRYFAGMSIPETAAALETSPRTVNRQWECARAWLYREMSGESER